MTEKFPIVFIVAIATNNVIGFEGGMPWHIPSDLKQFKKRTSNRPMIMGRKTFDSLPGVLPGRPHIVISSKASHDNDTDQVFWRKTIDEALEKATNLIDERMLEKEIMVIGGGNLFSQMEPLASELHITKIKSNPEGDVFWTFDRNKWSKTDCYPIQQSENDSAPYEIEVYRPKNHQ